MLIKLAWRNLWGHIFHTRLRTSIMLTGLVSRLIGAVINAY